MVDLLLRNGAESAMKAKDLRSFLPIHYAVVKDHSLVLRFLHRGNSHIRFNILDEHFKCNGHTLMALAIQNGAYNCIKALVEYGANCNEKDA